MQPAQQKTMIQMVHTCVLMNSCSSVPSADEKDCRGNENRLDGVMWQDLKRSMNNVLERYDRFYDPEISRRWLDDSGKNTSQTIATRKGLLLVIHRIPSRNKVNYEGFMVGQSLAVASMSCRAPRAGRVQISKAQVYELGGINYRRRGIASAIYDLIEQDVVAAGGQSIEPHWGFMTDEAIALWSSRRPAYSETLEELNSIGQSASGLFD